MEGPVGGRRPLRGEDVVKRFRCGDVVPGCTAEFVGTEAEILAEAREHVEAEHGLPELPPELEEAVRHKAQPA
jgi:predicted small metal-binding protein